MSNTRRTLVHTYIGIVVACAGWYLITAQPVAAQAVTPTVEPTATVSDPGAGPASIPTSAVLPPTSTRTSGGGGGSSAPTGTPTPTTAIVPTVTLTVTDVPVVMPSVTPIPQAPSRLPVTGFIDGSDVWQNTSLVALMSVLGIVGVVFFLYGRE